MTRRLNNVYRYIEIDLIIENVINPKNTGYNILRFTSPKTAPNKPLNFFGNHLFLLQQTTTYKQAV